MKRDEILAAMKGQHRAIDCLMAMLVAKDSRFMPTKSGLWPLLLEGKRVIEALEAEEAAQWTERTGKTFTCATCHRVLPQTWTDEEVVKELEARTPRPDTELLGPICGDCCKQIKEFYAGKVK